MAFPRESPASPGAAGIAPTGWARLLRAPEGISSTGERLASPFGQFSWAMFDFGRVPFILLVTIYIFAPYFANTVVVRDAVRGQALWGDIQAISGLVIAMLAPFIGAMADAGGRRKPWIAVFAALIAIPSALLWYARPAGQGLSLLQIGLCVGAASVAYEFASVFYNAMLPSIASPARIGGLSGLGLAMGNASGVVLLIFMLVAFVLPGAVSWPFVPAHPLFGIGRVPHGAERLAGPIAALSIAVFAIPLFLWTPDRPPRSLGVIRASVAGIRSVFATLASLRRFRNVARYLVARLFFNDGMTAILTFGGVYAAGTFHWGALALAAFGIVLSVFAVFGGFYGGWLDNRFGSKTALFVSVGGTLVMAILLISMAPDRILWFIPYDPKSPPVHALPLFRTWPELIYLAIATLIAVSVSASYANARTMMARIAPADRMTEFFGLYSLSGQSTSFLATTSVTLLTVWTASQRGGMIAVLAFLSLGLIGLVWVREERAVQE
ncbi:MAG: MFS transporter [Rhizomicrobium sp.]